MKKIFVATLTLFLAQCHPAHAEQYLAMQFTDNVRIMLSKVKCDKAGYRAAAQRIDGQFMRGCWSNMQDHKNMVHIQWEGGDFSEFPVNGFTPV